MARTGKFACLACRRTFSMAAHLARHRSAMHAAKGRKKTQRKLAPKGAAGRPARRTKRAAPRHGQARGLMAGVVGHLGAYRDELVAQRAQVDSQLAAVDGALSALGATAAVARVTGRRRTPGAREGSLRDFIGRVLRARPSPIAVKDVTAAVLKAGYQSRDRMLGHSVNKFLAAMPNVVKVARGQYRLRK